jgi:hypothetical protein
MIQPRIALVREPSKVPTFPAEAMVAPDSPVKANEVKNRDMVNPIPQRKLPATNIGQHTPSGSLVIRNLIASEHSAITPKGFPTARPKATAIVMGSEIDAS